VSTPLTSTSLGRRTFNKKALNKQFCKTIKAQERAFLTFLSDLDVDTGDDTSPSSSSDDESKWKAEDKLNGLCFLTKSIKEGFCGMAVDHDRSSDSDATGNNSDSEVPPSVDDLATKLEMMNDALLS